MGTKITTYIFVAYFLIYFIGKAIGYWGKNRKHPPPTFEELRRREEDARKRTEECDKRSKERQQSLKEQMEKKSSRNQDGDDLPF